LLLLVVVCLIVQVVYAVREDNELAQLSAMFPILRDGQSWPPPSDDIAAAEPSYDVEPKNTQEVAAQPSAVETAATVSVSPAAEQTPAPTATAPAAVDTDTPQGPSTVAMETSASLAPVTSNYKYGPMISAKPVPRRSGKSICAIPGRCMDAEMHASLRWSGSSPDEVKLKSKLSDVKQAIILHARSIQNEEKWLTSVQNIMKEYTDKLKKVQNHIQGQHTELLELMKSKRTVRIKQKVRKLRADLKLMKNEMEVIMAQYFIVKEKFENIEGSKEKLSKKVKRVEKRIARLLAALPKKKKKSEDKKDEKKGKKKKKNKKKKKAMTPTPPATPAPA
jgi:hypothetical protein